MIKRLDVTKNHKNKTLPATLIAIRNNRILLFAVKQYRVVTNKRQGKNQSVTIRRS